MKEQQEPLPCPLCGSTNLFLRDIAGWELDCRDCELSLVLADDPSREGLVTRWNTRPACYTEGHAWKQWAGHLSCERCNESIEIDCP